MGDGFAFWYRKSHIVRFKLAVLLFIVLISILFCPTVASAVVDVTLAWDASSGADGYRLFYREDGQSYDYDTPDWEGGGTTCTIPGLDESSTYHFVVRAYNGFGESGDSNEEHLYPSASNQAPTASFTATPTSGDAPLSVGFNASTSSDPDGSIVSYDWAFGNGGGTGMTPSHTYTSAGTYTVTLTVTDDDGATDSASTVIQVTTAPVPNQPPTASFTASSTSGDAPLDVTFDGSGSSDPDGSIVSYDWAFGNGGGTGMSPSHTYTSAGTYTVTLTVTDDDGATDSSSKLIQITDPPPPASNLPPNQPVISSPYQGETETDLLLSVETEPFSEPDGDAHQETQWQIVKAADSTVVLEIVSSEHLTKLNVPHAVLDRNTTYSVSVQFVDVHSEPSLWSDPVAFTTHNGVVDLDGNGIPDDSEVDDTVDLNQDGIPDNDQPDVIKSAKSAVAGKEPLGVCITATDVNGIVVMEPIHPSEILDKKNKPKKFLFGLIAYRLQVPEQGGTVEVKVFYAEDISGATRYYLYDTVKGWQDHTQYTTFNPDGHSVTVELQDGGHGDSDGVANGIIVDPGGVASAASGGDIGAGGGCFITTANAKHTERHDWLQSIFRVLLLPLVGVSYILTRTSLVITILVGFLLIISLISFYTVIIIYRRRIPKV